MEVITILGWMMLVIIAFIVPRTIIAIFSCYVAYKWGKFDNSIIGPLLVTGVIVGAIVDFFNIWNWIENPNNR